VLVDIDPVSVIAAYQLVVHACGSQWRRDFPSSLRTTRLHNELICCN